MYCVYRFLDKENKVVYIGFTGNINERMVSGHFIKNGHLKKEEYETVKKVEYVKIENKDEALFNEMHYIKLLNPIYNTIIPNVTNNNYNIYDNWIFYCEINDGKIVKKIKESDIIGERARIGIAIKIELNNKLSDLAKETRIPKSKLLDEAVELLLNKYERGE